jgi:peptide deformylase
LNERAEPVTIHAEGWYARILQHEIDHLNGTLYIDRMYTRSFTTIENADLFWKSRTVQEVRRELDS